MKVKGKNQTHNDDNNKLTKRELRFHMERCILLFNPNNLMVMPRYCFIINVSGRGVVLYCILIEMYLKDDVENKLEFCRCLH